MHLTGVYIVHAGSATCQGGDAPADNQRWLEGGDWVQGPHSMGDAVYFLLGFEDLPVNSVLIGKGFYTSVMGEGGILMAGAHESGKAYYGIAPCNVKLSVHPWDPNVEDDDEGALELLTICALLHASSVMN